MKAKVVFLLMFATVILTDAAKLLTSQDGYERIVVSRSEPLHLYAPGCIFEKNRKDSLYARFYIVDERLPNGVDGIDAIRVTIYHEYAAGYPLKLKMARLSIRRHGEDFKDVHVWKILDDTVPNNEYAPIIRKESEYVRRIVSYDYKSEEISEFWKCVLSQYKEIWKHRGILVAGYALFPASYEIEYVQPD